MTQIIYLTIPLFLLIFIVDTNKRVPMSTVEAFFLCEVPSSVYH